MEPTTANQVASGATHAFRRAVQGRLVGGVAAGLADYFDVDVVLVRIAMVALAFLGGLAVPLYAAAWLLVPEEGSNESIAERWMPRVLGADHHERREDVTTH
jgi:phage shock protein PspC (stress-responsive transcriptional regulator)